MRIARAILPFLSGSLAAMSVTIWAFSYDKGRYSDQMAFFAPRVWTLGPFEIDSQDDAPDCRWSGEIRFNEYDSLRIVPATGALTISYWRDIPNDRVPQPYCVALGDFGLSERVPPVFKASYGVGQTIIESNLSDAAKEHAHTTTTYVRTICFPFWFPTLLFSAWPVVAFIRGPMRRRLRCKRGLCVKCGYNLIGLPEPRCPECGKEFEPRPARTD